MHCTSQGEPVSHLQATAAKLLTGPSERCQPRLITRSGEARVLLAHFPAVERMTSGLRRFLLARKRIAIVAFAWLASTALANDGVGAVGVGGVMTLGRTDAVAMRSEVLEISTRRIDVDYEFVNETGNPVTLPVLFPLPEYGGLSEPDDDWRGGQPANFSVLIDGVASPFTTHVSALLATEDASAPRDVTTVLRQIGLDDRQIALLPGAFTIAGQDISTFDPATSRRAPAVTRSQLKALRTRGLLREDPHLREPDTPNHPAWKVRIVYAWTVTFPPGKPVSVRHAYAPFFGSGITQSWLADDGGASAKALRDEFCADPGLIRRLERSTSPAATPIWGATVGYILTTANTWAGPIRDFTLRLKKSSEDETISLCFPGQFKKLDALTLESRIANFVPAADLRVRFLATGRQGARLPYTNPDAPRFGGAAPLGLGPTTR